MTKRIDDISSDGYLELQKTEEGIIISVHKDPDSKEIGNSVQFFNEGSLSPRIYNALINLFRHGEKTSSDQIRVIETDTENGIIELFREKDLDIIISTKPDTVEIKFEDIRKEIKQSLNSLYEAIERENQHNPLS